MGSGGYAFADASASACCTETGKSRVDWLAWVLVLARLAGGTVYERRAAYSRSAVVRAALA